MSSDRPTIDRHSTDLSATDSPPTDSSHAGAAAAGDSELAAERAHLAASRAALRRMRERAEHLYRTGAGVAWDGYSAETLGTTLWRRVLELADQPDTPLFFGKITFGDTGEQAGEAHYIGRRHVTDDEGEPMVLDWRAPLSRVFYRASAADPHGVAVRRRFGFAGGELTAYEDEHLDRGEDLGTASRILTAEIERPRVGPMRDIVATIQPDQDEIVRTDLATTVCVQGAPGTGKTAVGLHRAAYLLYAYRERLRRAGVLVVGPNRAFLRYIGAVLPALGEVEVQQVTVDELFTTPVRGSDPPDVAALKHDARMAEVLRRALWRRVTEPTEPLEVPDGSMRLRLRPSVLAEVVTEARESGVPYATGRERVLTQVVNLLRRQVELRRASSPSDAWVRRIGRSRPVTAFLDAVWPQVTPEELVFRLLSDPEELAAAAAGLLDPEEQERLLWRRRPRSVRSAPWSPADAVLVDEAAGLIARTPGFGHVVVDEAQDLSPMQARALARRSVHGSLTVLGDLAQATAPWSVTDWRTLLAHLGRPEAGVAPLTTGFRVPAAVLALANRLLPALGVDVPPAVSLRRDGELEVRQVPDAVAAVVEATADALRHEGSVGVIAADGDVPAVAAALAGAGIATTGPDDPGASRVTVVPATVVKGLEYDHVVVVEPAAIVAAEPRGLHRLYVVLTRAVSRLTVLHAAPLPEPLSADS